MTSDHDPGRRNVMTALVAATAQAAAHAGETPGLPAKTLVAYFSRTGNTRVVAGLIQRARNADLFEIVPAAAYPQEYLATVAQARHERDSGFEPALASRVKNLAAYDTLFLGFPIWGENAPPVIRSFLSALDLSGKTLIPFITHGGYGPGSSRAVLARQSPNARLREGFLMEMDQERRTMERVTQWLGGADAA